MSVLHIPNVHAHYVSKQIPREKNFLRDFLLSDFTIKKLVKTSAAIRLNMESCEPDDEEELLTFSLGMEFLTPHKEQKEKENKESKVHTRMNSPVSFLTNLRQDRLQRNVFLTKLSTR